jgi:large subunit ribosomal protein L24
LVKDLGLKIMMSRVKKNDSVIVLSGRNEGKQGLVIDVDHKNGSVIVKDVEITTRHVKAKKAGEKSGIIKKERYIPLHKVMPVCPSCKKPCRVQISFIKGSDKLRVCHRCKEAF